MTGISVGTVEYGLDDAPPTGTAIVRPARHVQAVRERHAQQLAERASHGESRSARAWSWVLGESVVAPVTDHVTDAVPSRADIEAEIAEADERRLRGDRQNRTDGAASVLRWLIGADDRVPVRGKDRGELVGGFGDVIRSPGQIVRVMDDAKLRKDVEPLAAGYLDGVIATMEWVLGERPQAPVSGRRCWPVATSQLKEERLRAGDRHDQASEAIAFSIDWLLGDTTILPARQLPAQSK